MDADARRKYAAHKGNAKRRGIEFEFTFEEWWEIWAPHFHRRGTATDQLQMCRTRDEGGYRPGNVRIDTQHNNAKEAKQSSLRRANVEAWTIEGEDRTELRDWLFVRHHPFSNPRRLLELAQEERDEG